MNPCRDKMCRGTLLGILLVRALVVAAEETPTQPERRPYKAVFRINTNISAGTLSPEDVVREARRCGAKILVFSDQFICRAEWGLWPLRNLLRFTRQRPSVATFGFAEYVKRLDDLARNNPDMVILAGLDVAPHHHWEGSPFLGTLTVHQWSEQLTLVPVSADQPFAAMPVVANPNQKRRWGLGSVLLFWPLGLLILAMLWRARGTMVYRDEQGKTHKAISPARRRLSTLLGLVGVLFLLNNAPFTLTSTFSPYRKGRAETYQEFIDWIRQNTSAQTFWSAPEITMREEMSGVQLVTEPYVADLVDTHGATGFAAIYGDARTMHRPGKEWDTILLDYCEGKRDRPLWAVGERDFHGASRIDGVQTVFLLTELSKEAVVEEGLRQGKMYAMCYSASGPEIVLDRFSVSPMPGPRRASVEDLDFGGGKVSVEAQLGIPGHRTKQIDLTVRIVRNGGEIDQKKMAIPASEHGTQQSVVIEDAPPDGRKNYYRLIAEWPGGEIVSNPIFATCMSRKTDHD